MKEKWGNFFSWPKTKKCPKIAEVADAAYTFRGHFDLVKIRPAEEDVSNNHCIWVGMKIEEHVPFLENVWSANFFYRLAPKQDFPNDVETRMKAFIDSFNGEYWSISGKIVRLNTLHHTSILMIEPSGNAYYEKCGENYFHQTRNPCPTCNRPFHQLHIGRSCVGWCFELNTYPEHGIHSLEDWVKRFPMGTIVNSDGRQIDQNLMIDRICNRASEAEIQYKKEPPPYNTKSWEEYYSDEHCWSHYPTQSGLLAYKSNRCYGNYCLSVAPTSGSVLSTG